MPQRVRSTASRGLFGRFATFLALRELKKMAADRFNGLLKNAWILGVTELRIIHTFGEGVRAIGLERVSDNLKEAFISTSFDGDDYNELLLRFGLEESFTCSAHVIEFGESNATVTVSFTRSKALKSEALILHLEFDPPYSSLAD